MNCGLCGTLRFYDVFFFLPDGVSKQMKIVKSSRHMLDRYVLDGA